MDDKVEIEGLSLRQQGDGCYSCYCEVYDFEHPVAARIRQAGPRWRERGYDLYLSQDADGIMRCVLAPRKPPSALADMHSFGDSEDETAQNVARLKEIESSISLYPYFVTPDFMFCVVDADAFFACSESVQELVWGMPFAMEYTGDVWPEDFLRQHGELRFAYSP